MLCKCGGELEINTIGFTGTFGQCKVCGEKTRLKLFTPTVKEPDFMFVKYRRKR